MIALKKSVKVTCTIYLTDKPLTIGTTEVMSLCQLTVSNKTPEHFRSRWMTLCCSRVVSTADPAQQKRSHCHLRNKISKI